VTRGVNESLRDVAARTSDWSNFDAAYAAVLKTTKLVAAVCYSDFGAPVGNTSMTLSGAVEVAVPYVAPVVPCSPSSTTASTASTASIASLVTGQDASTTATATATSASTLTAKATTHVLNTSSKIVIVDITLLIVAMTLVLTF